VKEGEGILTVLNQIGFVSSNGEAKAKNNRKSSKTK